MGKANGAPEPANQPLTSNGKAPGPTNLKMWLRLYVAGNAPNSVLAVANARAICEEFFATTHELEIVDVITHPELALADGIIVTPTLVRLAPPPIRRVIGNLENRMGAVTALSGT